MIRAAFDIETVSPDVPVDEYPDFEDPTDFEFQSAAIAVEEDGEHVTTHHLTRDAWGAEHELALIERIVDQLESTSPEATFTFNGEDFDFWLLKERARLCGEKTGNMSMHERVQGIEKAVGHDDLQPPAWARWGRYTTLEESLVNADVFDSEAELLESQTLLTEFEHGYEHREWDWKDSWDDDVDVLDSTDVAYLGEDYLDGLEDGRDDEEFQELVKMLDHYARNDVDHLFRLADARPY